MKPFQGLPGRNSAVPIFADIHSFISYPPRAIQADLLGALLKAFDGRRGPVNSVVLRLECYLQITRQTLSLGELDTPGGQSKMKAFLGAQFSEKFDRARRVTRLAEAARIRKILLRLGAKKTLAAIANMTIRWKASGELQSLVEQFEHTELDQERVSFWNGWQAQNRVGEMCHFEFHNIYEKFGAEFATHFHGAICDWQQGHVIPLRAANSFAAYLSANYDDIDVADARLVSSLVRSFVIFTCKSAHQAGDQIQNAIMSARDLIIFLEAHVFGKIWADPLPKIVKPSRKKDLSHRTKVRQTPEGGEVKYSMITEIPLQLTDKEVMERLLTEIGREMDILMKWARAEVNDTQHRIYRRKQLAKSGTVNYIARKGTDTRSGIQFRRSRNCPDRLNHAAATFEARGFSHLTTREPANNLYPLPLPEITWQLGIATPKTLLAYATLLVAIHPAITASFIETLELFDKDGMMVGFVESDGGHYLVGEKRRRGAALAEQQIHLNEETTLIVRHIIDLTSPLRDHLRNVDDDNWRKLFLSADSLSWTPRPWRPVLVASRAASWLAERFQSLAGLQEDDAESLSKRFSLTRLRNSAGVEVYIKTGSVQRMAEALGHKEHKPSLLDRYLPRPIQEFFVERWIRQFQTKMICVALKDSPHLLRGSNFQTMVELDDFLGKQGVLKIPAHLEDPDSFCEQGTSTAADHRVVFGVETGILTLLLSLELAVNAAERIPSLLATKWARVSACLIPYLEAQQEQCEFHKMVRAARLHADPYKMQDLIYE